MGTFLIYDAGNVVNPPGSTTQVLPTTPGILSSFTKPEGVTRLVVECWGAGGAGGYATSNNSAGGGGAGGSYSKKTITNLPAQSITYNLIIGAGGTSNVATPISNPGGDTWVNFSTTVPSSTPPTTVAEGVLAKGGVAGNPNNGAGGIGSTTGCLGDTVFAGGSGGTGANNPSGGGGGGAGSNGAGGSATGGTAGTGTADYGGNGAVGVTTNVTGIDGSSYGGGGSGGYKLNQASSTRSGGSGAAGIIRITFTDGTTNFILYITD